MRVLVTGGTGRLARRLFALAATADVTFRVLSRRARPADATREWAQGDLASGTGLTEAVRGVDAVLHLASDPANSADDVSGTRHLVEAAASAGVTHLLFLSIIGVDRIPYPYYRHKLAAEAIVESGRVPWTILRAAQFHSFVDWHLARLARMPVVMPVPFDFKVQCVDDAEMAQRLLAGLREGPHGRARDFAGPEILTLREAASEWRRVRSVRKPLVRLPTAGAVARGFSAGYNTNADAERGRVTWREWLARKVS